MTDYWMVLIPSPVRARCPAASQIYLWSVDDGRTQQPNFLRHTSRPAAPAHSSGQVERRGERDGCATKLWRDDWHSRPTRIEMAPFVRHSGVVEMSAYVRRSRVGLHHHLHSNCTAAQGSKSTYVYKFLRAAPGATANYELRGSAYRHALREYPVVIS